MNPSFDTYQKALIDAIGSKMERAWRNRSNSTRGQWTDYARKIWGADVSIQRINRLASYLYVACGWYARRAESATFVGAHVSSKGWMIIALMTEDFQQHPPDKALERGAWEERQKEQLT